MKLFLTTVPMSRETWSESTAGETPGAVSERILWWLTRIVLPIVRLTHRASIEGWENLPQGPYVLVANHSGGLATAEIFSFAALYAQRFGNTRPLAGFAHVLAFRVWGLRHLFRATGVIPSSYRAAGEALERGVPLLVFPGGDYEALRPVWHAQRVDWNGRSGFARVAQRAWVPIVPMGIRGSHFSAPMLVRSQLLSYLAVWPRIVGVKRWPLTVFGVVVAILLWESLPWTWPVRAVCVWLWLLSPFIMTPFIPWKVHMKIGVPIPPEDLFGARDASDERAGEAAKRAEQAVQALVAARD